MRHVLPVVAALFLIAATPGQVPEPTGFWQGPLHGYTPNTVTGGTVVDTAAVAKLVADGHPLLLDVAEPDKKPAGMAPTALWMPAHRSLPGAAWLPSAGSGRDDAAFIDAFKARMADLTGGDRAKPIVAFCHPECWGSWNAAKRLVGLGYTKVYWYTDGMEGWQAEHDTTIVKADPRWTMPPAQGHGRMTRYVGFKARITVCRRGVFGLVLALSLMPLLGPAHAEAPAPVPFDRPTFEAAQRAGKPILIEIAAPWCPACKAQMPILSKLRQDPRFNDLQTYTIDFDSRKDLMRFFGAKLQSTLICFKGMTETGRSVGETQAEWIEALLEKTQ